MTKTTTKTADADADAIRQLHHTLAERDAELSRLRRELAQVRDELARLRIAALDVLDTQQALRQ